jgi:hypothetical protein
VSSKVPVALAVVLVVLAAVTILHQKLGTGRWFSLYQVINHETIAMCLVAAAVALLIGFRMGRG